MPNIISQTVDETGIEIVFSNEQVFSVTRIAILARFDAESGPVLRKRLQTRDWLLDSIIAVAGELQLDKATIDIDFRDADGSPTLLQIHTLTG